MGFAAPSDDWQALTETDRQKGTRADGQEVSLPLFGLTLQRGKRRGQTKARMGPCGTPLRPLKPLLTGVGRTVRRRGGGVQSHPPQPHHVMRHSVGHHLFPPRPLRRFAFSRFPFSENSLFPSTLPTKAQHRLSSPLLSPWEIDPAARRRRLQLNPQARGPALLSPLSPPLQPLPPRRSRIPKLKPPPLTRLNLHPKKTTRA